MRFYLEYVMSNNPIGKTNKNIFKQKESGKNQGCIKQ